MKARQGDYFTTVIEDDHGQVVASGTVLVERKFIRECGMDRLGAFTPYFFT